jgi:hypothetical protein
MKQSKPYIYVLIVLAMFVAAFFLHGCSCGCGNIENSNFSDVFSGIVTDVNNEEHIVSVQRYGDELNTYYVNFSKEQKPKIGMRADIKTYDTSKPPFKFYLVELK